MCSCSDVFSRFSEKKWDLFVSFRVVLASHELFISKGDNGLSTSDAQVEDVVRALRDGTAHNLSGRHWVVVPYFWKFRVSGMGCKGRSACLAKLLKYNSLPENSFQALCRWCGVLLLRDLTTSPYRAVLTDKRQIAKWSNWGRSFPNIIMKYCAN